MFKLLWSVDKFSVVGGKGSNSSDDWLAHKKIALPDMRGRTVFGVDESGDHLSDNAFGTTLDLGAVGGIDPIVTLIPTNIPLVNSSIQMFKFSALGSGSVSPPGCLVFSDDSIALESPQTASISIGENSPAPFTVCPPGIVMNYMIKL